MTQQTDADAALTLAVAQFQSDNCGQCPGIARAVAGPEPLPLPYQIAIDGSTDLSSCIVGPSGASVSSIEVMRSVPPSLYEYTILVHGQGPKGGLTSALNLVFGDASGDSYTLALVSSTPAPHTVSYNSDAPQIVSVQWYYTS